MLERDLESLFRREVTKHGGLAVKLAPVTAGTPDRMVLAGGQVYLVELKTTTGKLRPIQTEWHRKAAQRGVNVIVLYGPEEVRAWTAQLDNPDD